LSFKRSANEIVNAALEFARQSGANFSRILEEIKAFKFIQHGHSDGCLAHLSPQLSARHNEQSVPEGSS
jgi:hypothetical protein